MFDVVVLTGGTSKIFEQLLRLRGRNGARTTCGPTRVPQRQRRLSATERDELIAAYVAGEPTTELARCFGMHRSAVSLVLKQAGVLKPLAKLTEQQVDTALVLRGSGLFYRQIAERMGVDTQTVRRAVLRRLAAEDGRLGHA